MLGDLNYMRDQFGKLCVYRSHSMTNEIIIDRNELKILGKTEELLKIEPLEDKFTSFGFDVNVVDGHDFDEMKNVFSKQNTGLG